MYADVHAIRARRQAGKNHSRSFRDICISGQSLRRPVLTSKMLIQASQAAACLCCLALCGRPGRSTPPQLEHCLLLCPLHHVRPRVRALVQVPEYVRDLPDGGDAMDDDGATPPPAASAAAAAELAEGLKSKTELSS